MNNLLPCPFCGGPADPDVQKPRSDGCAWTFVWCKRKCAVGPHASGSCDTYFYNSVTRQNERLYSIDEAVERAKEHAFERWNTRAAQPQAVEGLPEPVAIIGSDYQLLWFSPAGMETLVQACARTGLEVGDKLVRQESVNAMIAQIAELEAENKRLDLAVSQADYSYDSDRQQWKREREELEAQLAKGKERLPERKNAGNFIGYRAYESAVLARGFNEAIDECQAAFAALQAELEKFKEANRQLSEQHVSERETRQALRAELDEAAEILRKIEKQYSWAGAVNLSIRIVDIRAFLAKQS